jgi:hypothetical protein
MTGKLSTLFGIEALIVEEVRVILEPAALAGNGSTHGVMISEWLGTRFRLIWRLA